MTAPIIRFAQQQYVAQNTTMTDTASEFTLVSPQDGPMAFEQPLSERMRTFLRIEFLYQQVRFHAGDLTGFSARAAVATLLEILAILEIGRAHV